MKKISYIIFLIFTLLIIIPIIILKSYTPNNSKPNNFNPEKIKTVKVYIYDEDKVEPMNLDDYIKGVVAAEMPATFEIEALKAQAVAARTYTLDKIVKAQTEVQEAHKGGDICTNFAHCQAWKSKEKLKDTWGIIGYYKYWNKICRAVDETSGLIVTYNGELINPLFHSTSGGKTENSEEVFSTELPYLKSVVSLGEEASPKFYGRVTLMFDQFKNKLSEIAQGIVLSKKDIPDIKVLQESEGGRIKSIQIGNKLFDGKEIRNIFSLNSTNFKITLEGSKVIIDTIGYGHGVGMSQFGANYMASQGNSFKDILKYYYKDTEVVGLTSITK